MSNHNNCKNTLSVDESRDSGNHHNHNNNNSSNHRQQQRVFRAPQLSTTPSVSSIALLNNMEKINMVPGFILKLWRMINDPQCDDLISWSENGQSFIITDPPRFSQELSKYFKHNNLSSFIRQLNMYGFRKVATIENSGLHPGTDDLHFYHPDFMRDKSDRLEAIKRKLPQKLADSVDLRNVYRGISEIEDKQNGVSKTLQEIKRENEMLWAELHDLRQKHQQQQLYISRLMKLIFEAMEQNGIKTNMLQIKRNSPLMIEGSSVTPDFVPTSVMSPNTGTCATPTTTRTSSVNETTLDPIGLSNIPTITTSPSPVSPGDTNAKISIASDNIMATTLADDYLHSLKKPRLGPKDDDIVDSQGDEVYQQQDPTSYDLEKTIELNTPVDTSNFDQVSQFQMVPNDQLQSHIESAEYQIDTLVPTIGDFDQDDLNLFVD